MSVPPHSASAASGNPSWPVRRAMADDFPALAELWRRSVEATHDFLLPGDPEYFGRGVGKVLLRHARDLHGALSLEVNEQNARALAFYQRQGFAVTGRSALDNAGRPYPLLYLAWRG